MIAVIADDLTGAAELAGTGLRYNLKVEIATEVSASTKADLLIISTDTRSLSVKEAQENIAVVTKALLKLKPTLIYKKIDSVLRGHVIAEIEAQLREMQLTKVLIVPANPHLGRTLRDGKYFLNDQPVHLTSFSSDPEFPITSSHVHDMLRVDTKILHILTTQKKHFSAGIMVGEARTTDDLKTWASSLDNETLPVGASGFFTAILNELNIKQAEIKYEKRPVKEPILFVCGTTFNKSRDAIKTIKSTGGPVSYMPEELVSLQQPTELSYESWTDEIVDLLLKNKKAIIAVSEASTKNTSAKASDLRKKTASVVSAVLKKILLAELVVEGGATASAIIAQQQFKTLLPVEELMPGVIRMSIEGKKDLYLTIKPGSYEWPNSLWNF